MSLSRTWAYSKAVSRWTGSWLSGPKAALDPGEEATQEWRGHRLGLPAEGPGSVASLASRAFALVVDVLLATLVAGLFTAPDLPRNWSLLSWFLITWVAVSFFGFTPGMVAAGIRVARVDGKTMVGPLRTVPRTVLVGLILPAVILDADGRGLHDRLAGTVVVRTR